MASAHLAKTVESGSGQLVLIPSKISVPNRPSKLTHRPRLASQLADYSTHQLTLIHGPAGYGKTSLSLDWINQLNHPVAWFSIDSADNEPVRFIAYLTACLQQATQRCPQSLEQVLTANPIHFESHISRLLMELANTDTPVLLVLDDYHWIDNEVIHQGLRFLIKHKPAFLHIVINSRSLPPLGLANLRLHDQLLEIAPDQLAFDEDDAHQFFADRLPFSLTPCQLAPLLQQVEGWPTVLQLIALLSTPDIDSFESWANEVVKGHTYLLDYLAEEVLTQVSPEIKQFLYFSSILDSMNDYLVKTVTGAENGQAMLEQVEQLGLFITPLDCQRHWYRYHPLFSTFLRHQLGKHYPGQTQTLHQRACAGWQQLGYIHEALTHAIAGENHCALTEILLKHGWSFYQQGQCRILQQALNSIPSATLATNAELTMLGAWVAQNLYQYDDVENLLVQAEQKLPQQMPQPQWQEIQCEFNTIRAQLAMNLGQIKEAQMLAQDALANLPEERRRIRTVALSVLGEASFCQGQLTKAQQMMEEAEQLARLRGASQIALWTQCQQSEIAMAQGYLQKAFNIQDKALQFATEHQVNHLPIMEFIHRVRAQVLFEWHHLDGAEKHSLAGIEILRPQGEHWFLQCYALLAKIALLRGKHTVCADYIQKLQQLMQGDDYHSDWMANAHATMLAYWQATQDMAAIERWQQAAPPLSPATNHFYQCHARNRARAEIYLNQPAKAIDILTSLQQQAVKYRLITDQNRNHICFAQAYWSQDERELALEHLEQALQLATTTGFISSFLLIGKSLIVMLKALKQDYPLADNELQRAERLIKLAQQQRSLNKSITITLDETLIGDILQQADIPELIKSTPLTKREWQVLSLIHSGLSNEQIAGHLEVAPSTIKTHIRSLYQKLNVNHRDEAIDIANKMLRTIQGD